MNSELKTSSTHEATLKRKAGMGLLAATITVLLLLCPGFIRMYSFAYDFWISYLSYFVVYLYLINRFPGFKKLILISALTPLIIIMILFLVKTLAKNYLPPGLPNLAGPILAVISAYLFYVNKKIARVIIVLFSAALCIFYFFWGMHWWLNFANFKTSLGKIHQEITPAWTTYVDINGNEKPGNLYVLDFWGSSCSICYKKFPVLQGFYDKYKNNGAISILAVNIPWRTDTPGMAQQILKDRNYTFPVVIGKPKADSIFGVRGYPTVILVKNHEILFRGDIEELEPVIQEQLNKK